MHKTPSTYPHFETEGLLFHITVLDEAIPGGPRGVWISNEAAASNLEMMVTERDGVYYRFIALNPLEGRSNEVPIALFHRITSQAMPGTSNYGNAVPIHVYGEWNKDLEQTLAILEDAIESKSNPPEVTQIAHQLLSDGYALSCNLVYLLRRKFFQYWLIRPTDLFHWSNVRYFSEPRQNWYSIGAADDFAPKLIGQDWAVETSKTWQPYILLRMIGADDSVEATEINNPVSYSLAEEMIATALVELRENRKRSAILHAIIALEASATRGLERLLRSRFAGLEQGAVLNAISKELSVDTLARVVYFHATDELAAPSIDWAKIKALYNVRNEVIHRGRRRLPDFETLKKEMIEVFNYIEALERTLSTIEAATLDDL